MMMMMTMMTMMIVMRKPLLREGVKRMHKREKQRREYQK
jgi:hypothetical protein